MVVKGNITFLTTPLSEKSDTLPQTLYKTFFHFRKKYLESRCWNSNNGIPGIFFGSGRRFYREFGEGYHFFHWVGWWGKWCFLLQPFSIFRKISILTFNFNVKVSLRQQNQKCRRHPELFKHFQPRPIKNEHSAISCRRIRRRMRTIADLAVSKSTKMSRENSTHKDWQKAFSMI